MEVKARTRNSKYKDSYERYDWLKANSICVMCGQEESEPNNIYCLECKEKVYETHKSYYKKNKEKIQKRHKEYMKNLYYKRKNKGLCTKCGRKVCKNSTTLCIDCYIKHNRRYKTKQGIQRIERPDYGLCFICGQVKLEDKKVCEKCYKKIILNLDKARNSTKLQDYRQESSAIFWRKLKRSKL